MDQLEVTWEMDPAEMDLLRSASGPLVVVSNHPHGGVDSLAMMQLLEAIRPGGWRLLSNQVICSIPEFGPNLIPVDPHGQGAASARLNARGLGQAVRHLNSGGVLGLFPAGRVAHWDRALQTVTDRPWTDHALRLATNAGAPVACLHIPGGNSARFLRIPPAWSRLRALALCRELVRPANRRLSVRLAAWLTAAEAKRMAVGPSAGARLQARCLLRADCDRAIRTREARTPPPAPPPIAERESPEILAASVAALAGRAEIPALGDAETEVLLFQGREAPALLRELGRCRELTFRAAGQGVGRERDLAEEDDYYRHLVLWHRERREIIGAYRLGVAREILAQRGPAGLYLDHVFRIAPEFYEKAGPAIELSRSFVMPEYQRDQRALALLWRGLAAAAQRFGSPTLFGSVTISNEHSPASRALLVEHLRRNYSDSAAMRRTVEARNPFQPETKFHSAVGAAYEGESIDALAPLIDTIERGQRGIPPLMRYYCSLGARFLAFHVEAQFRDALYCFLRVNLDTIPPKYRRRFMGTAGAKSANQPREPAGQPPS